MKIKNITEWIIKVVKYPYRLSELYVREKSSAIGQKVLIKTTELIQISTLKCGISSLELVFMDSQTIVPTFQHGFQTGFPITICINEKFL